MKELNKFLLSERVCEKRQQQQRHEVVSLQDFDCLWDARSGPEGESTKSSATNEVSKNVIQI